MPIKDLVTQLRESQEDALMSVTKTTEYESFQELYKDAVKGKLLPPATSNERFNVNSHLMQSIRWFNIFMAYIESTYPSAKPVEYLTRNNLKACVAIERKKENEFEQQWTIDSLLYNEDRSLAPRKPTVASFAIMHNYWRVIEPSKALTQTNVAHYAKEYNIQSSITLLRQYNRFYELTTRDYQRVSNRIAFEVTWQTFTTNP
jgi:hypothetical protein